MRHHAGSIIRDPRYAITELVANAWDAGATVVQVAWPEARGDIVVSDNGSGMTEQEFLSRWNVLNYNRLETQGNTVEFPPGSSGNKHRRAFGRNGIGRHAVFCFAATYTVVTTKNGVRTTALVQPDEEQPFKIQILSKEPSDGHGTIIQCVPGDCSGLRETEVVKLLGSKFIYEPTFQIHVNDTPVSFETLNGDVPTFTVQTPHGMVEVYRFDAEGGRTSDQSGVAWWVNDRLVGKRSWDIGDGALLDARTGIGKRLVYVVKANFLVDDVKADWSGFAASTRYLEVENCVADELRRDIHQFLTLTRRDRKRGVIARNRDTLKKLPPLAQAHVARFIEDVQRESPTISERDLANVVTVLANLELANTGYSLIERLSTLSPEDLDSLDEILAEWSVGDAKLVLNELGRRLRLIEKLQNIIDDPRADELHDLQPLFERGLWIFGPQFESLSFTSNRSLTTVVRRLLAKRHNVDETRLMTPRRRPDFVVLPTSSVGVYTADGFGRDHEVDEIGHVMVVELKRGGFAITDDEVNQAQAYARELRRAGVPGDTPITCYVLGSNVNADSQDEVTMGAARVIPRAYRVVLQQAHQRTFNLQKKLAALVPIEVDEDMRELLDDNLFDQASRL
ncbi:hypothetical protein BOO71_0003460 [Deinococcus marmoris]|uniref:ATP-binding protein n=2 Tax=Deinococcus marmoris TaxID=249408 RepID=A0A1U7P229_9DEIO|nr:hypothetical protein BOO71_0003460 [Deinococcus marmoris]